ncbi:DHS-like NAD/FAD-binding domain-containing protein [Corynespora cassiicola Philippines]|uniref:DHS-like NAD/FAD-binding domain-containing protein n=1 Tax=Corynespora cassiicola Philippines TaxID=1448308 RepID=A0A2T2P5K6_CORCC|nr:DHS-like NAD/FAD-binding domain-containing protein [Corynespora cassiicola Philippines]
MAFNASQGGSSPLSSVPSSAASDSDLSDLSELSKSPTPPPGFTFASERPYPSPSASQQSSAKTSPAPDNMATPPSSNDDDPRPRKKRKAEPKERTTERLDLTRDLSDEDKVIMERLINAVHKKRKIVIIAGAGISTSSGIPDFRSSNGLFNNLRKEHKLKSSGKDLFDASVYQDDDSTSSFHAMVRNLSQQVKAAQPTAFHHLIATLAHEGRLLRLYTQNVDGIDTSLPPLQTQIPLPKKGPWPKTIQVHGGLDHMVCSKCHALSDFDAEIFNGPTPPACPTCLQNDENRRVAEMRSRGVGRLRPRMVLYNETNPDEDAIGACAAQDLRTRPDAVIVVGTTLKVPGTRRIAREMCAVVRDRRDGITVWINNDPEPAGVQFANCWDLVVKGPCDEVARYAAMRKWNDPMDYKEVTDEQLCKTKEKQKAEVIVSTPKKSKPNAVLQVQGQLTPVQSPRLAARATVKQESEEHLSTPTKKGAKRKSQVDAFTTLQAKAPAKRAQAQPKKGTGRKGKAKKPTQEDNRRITDGFKVAKNPTSAQASKFIPSKYNAASAPTATNNSQLVILEKTMDVVPLTPKRRVTGIKKEYMRSRMAPISSSDSRFNSSPTRPSMETFTPIKPSPFVDHDQLTPDQRQLMDELNESRPSSASSQRNEILRPSGPLPSGMGGLLN